MLIISLFIDGVSISHVDELEDRFGGLFWSACNQLEKLNPEELIDSVDFTTGIKNEREFHGTNKLSA